MATQDYVTVRQVFHVVTFDPQQLPWPLNMGQF
jgi:hypothetical protein